MKSLLNWQRCIQLILLSTCLIPVPRFLCLLLTVNFQLQSLGFCASFSLSVNCQLQSLVFCAYFSLSMAHFKLCINFRVFIPSCPNEVNFITTPAIESPPCSTLFPRFSWIHNFFPFHPWLPALWRPPALVWQHFTVFYSLQTNSYNFFYFIFRTAVFVTVN